MTAIPTTLSTDVLRERLQDPQVAANLAILLDHADLLALMVQSIDGLLQRADTISASVADGLQDARAMAESAKVAIEPARRLAGHAPAIADAADVLLSSGMFAPDAVQTLGRLAAALADGAAVAQDKGTTVNGLLPMLRILRDPDVGRGLGLMVEVARALGRTLERGADA